jgi:hypothetical protein
VHSVLLGAPGIEHWYEPGGETLLLHREMLGGARKSLEEGEH